MKFLAFLLVSSTLAACAHAHGYLINPPNRGSAWREDPIKFPAYYQDNGLYCGDSSIMMNSVNQGRCGICGEVWSETKRLEKGGDLYRGYIVRTYKNTDVIDITYQLTANHLGAFEFRLCNVDNMATGEATQECLDNLLLEEFGTGKNFIMNTNLVDNAQAPVNYRLRIPKGYVCNHCVLQAKWYTTHQCGGPINQETFLNCNYKTKQTFVNCADIRITGLEGETAPPVWTTQSTVVPVTTTQAGVVLALWSQCGGQGWAGGSNCGPNAKCVFQNQYYSQCVPL